MNLSGKKFGPSKTKRLCSLLWTRKSKLRKPPLPSLGKQYQASAVSRDKFEASESDEDYDQFDEEESDDPFARKRTESEDSSEVPDEDGNLELNSLIGENPEDGDEEIDSDEVFTKEDATKYESFKFRGSKSNASQDIDDIDEAYSGSDNASTSAEESTKDNTDDAEDESMSDTSSDQASMSFESEPSTDQDPKSSRHQGPSERSALRSLLSSSSKNLASSLFTAAASDAKKGLAVKQQYETFDKLLDLRIKLQKPLTAADNLPQDPSLVASSEIELIKSTEEAALKLFNDLIALRTKFFDNTTTQSSQSEGRAPKRRKLSTPLPATLSTPSSTLATTVHDLHEYAVPQRRAILQKWSVKTRPISAAPAPSRLLQNNSSSSPSISDLLRHLDASVLSLASSLNLPHSSPSSPSSSASFPRYDDTPFYQSLLRDLVAHRSSLDPTLNASHSIPVLPTKLHLSGNRGKKKDVDTKASKGRKVRYTVHEKLLNWMPSGDERGTWGEDGRREFFASLLGQRGVLREDVLSGEEGEEREMDGVDGDAGLTDNGRIDGAVREEDGRIRLFR